LDGDAAQQEGLPAATEGGHAPPHEPADPPALRGASNGIPMIGAPGPRGCIAMGGMFTVLKVREGLETYDDPGWYQNPEGTEASPATEEELARDLEPEGGAPLPPKPGHEHHGH
jgi:hypothetical protein